MTTATQLLTKVRELTLQHEGCQFETTCLIVDDLQELLFPPVHTLPQWAQERRAQNLCAIIDGWCVSHEVAESLDHHLAMSPRHTSLGFATND